MVNPSELGSYTNNLSNRRGIKKLLKEVSDMADDLDDVYTKSETYSKTEVNTALLTKVDIASALPEGKETTDTVTFQDLIDLGIIVIPPEPEPESEP